MLIKDPVSDQRLSLVYPAMRPQWLSVRRDLYELYELQIRVTDSLRTFKEQFDVYSQGRKLIKGTWEIVDASKVVSYALPGQSYHNYGLALDSAFHGDDPYLEKRTDAQFELIWGDYGRLCEKYGLAWGGRWPGKKRDRPHCESTYGLSLHELQLIYERSGLVGIFKTIDRRLAKP